ncbi:MAG: hypothetical protein AABZ14_08640 [Candidatus Margulisiibacteriota bacterium]
MGMKKKVISEPKLSSDMRNKLEELKVMKRKLKSYSDPHFQRYKQSHIDLVKTGLQENMLVALLSIKPDLSISHTVKNVGVKIYQGTFEDRNVDSHKIQNPEQGMPYCKAWGEEILNEMIRAINEIVNDSPSPSDLVSSVVDLFIDVAKEARLYDEVNARLGDNQQVWAIDEYIPVSQ